MDNYGAGAIVADIRSIILKATKERQKMNKQIKNGFYWHIGRLLANLIWKSLPIITILILFMITKIFS